jgi:hypothetical protein
MEIGDWVRRAMPEGTTHEDPEYTKWHFVESIVSDAAFTRCGRRMEPEVDGEELSISKVMPLTRLIDQPQLCGAGCLNG